MRKSSMPQSMRIFGSVRVRSQRAASYMAVNSVIINIVGCMGGLASGVIAKVRKDWHWQPGIPGISSVGFYEVLFALSGLLRLAAAVLFLPMMVEHNAGGAMQTVRFISANIYNNVFSAILLPLRYLRPSTAVQMRKGSRATPLREYRRAA